MRRVTDTAPGDAELRRELRGLRRRFALDWNAYFAANPLALGSPFSVGAKVYAQGWYRDPPAPKSTNLSNGLELTVAP